MDLGGRGLLCQRRCQGKVTGSLSLTTELSEGVDFVAVLGRRSLGPGVANCKIVFYLLKEQEGGSSILFVFFCALKNGSLDK